MVPKQQVLYILAGQTDAAGAVEISHAMLAEVVAVSAISYRVEELLFLAAGPADSIAKSDARVTGDAVRF